MTLADQITLARLGLAPVAVAAYLCLPIEYNLCFWACGLLCGAAELTDYFDGMVARARKEVSDFGKLADPFCDVLYRISLFLVFLLPAGGVGIAPSSEPVWLDFLWQPATYQVAGGGLGLGLLPWLPVWLMVMREIVAGALRAMSATRGLVLAARRSGKFKAWLQGITIIVACGMPALLGGPSLSWLFDTDPGLYLPIIGLLTWVSALVSVASMTEYIWVNRAILGQLIERRKI